MTIAAMDQATRDKINRDTAYHRAHMARRAEMMQQDLDHRRLMLGLERFHQYESSRIRKLDEIVDEPALSRAKRPRVEARDLGPGVVGPKANLFKQVAEDGSGGEEPLFLRVVWMDSDCGGLFRWTEELEKGNAEKKENGSERKEENENGSAVREDKVPKIMKDTRNGQQSKKHKVRQSIGESRNGKESARRAESPTAEASRDGEETDEVDMSET